MTRRVQLSGQQTFELFYNKKPGSNFGVDKLIVALIFEFFKPLQGSFFCDKNSRWNFRLYKLHNRLAKSTLIRLLTKTAMTVTTLSVGSRVASFSKYFLASGVTNLRYLTYAPDNFCL